MMSYSNRSGLCDELSTVISRLESNGSEYSTTVSRSVTSDHTPKLWRVRDRLDEEAIRALIESFKAGTPKYELAARHSISLTSVKTILRERGVRR